jgi:hypothetical protein
MKIASFAKLIKPLNVFPEMDLLANMQTKLNMKCKLYFYIFQTDYKHIKEK